MRNKRIILFLVLCSLYFIIAEVTKYALNLNSLIYNTLAESLTTEQLNKGFAKIRKWQHIGYILSPFIIFLKTQIIAGVLGIGTFLLNIKLSHKTLWRIVLKAEFIFLGVGIIKIMWFYFFQTDYTLGDVQFFYPLSMLSVVGHENIEPWYIYPLQTLNVFEVVYWGVLALFIDKELKVNEKNNTGIKIVACSYGPALFLWVIAVMFFTLNIN